MSFSTKNVEVKENLGGGSKYLTYGVQKAAITGYDLKTAASGKQQVSFLMESPKVTDAGFEPDESAKLGGKVGRVQVTIYIGKDDEEQNNQFIERIALIAKKLNVSEKVDAVSADNLKDYLDRVIPIIRGKFAWWAITGEEYAKKDSDKIGVVLGLRRYGFVASLDDMEANPNHIKPFDKGNKYDYKALSSPSRDLAVDPISEAFGDLKDNSNEMPWDVD